MDKDTQNADSGKLVLITGLAGAGYSTALNVLEDVGYLAVDNLPLALVSQLISIEVETSAKKVAVSIDGRTSGFDGEGLKTLLADARARLGGNMRLVFLTASKDTLYRRYNTTRRHHPLNHTGEAESLVGALELDEERMMPLESLADVKIDTSNASPGELRQALLTRLDEMVATPLPVTVESFSYRQGIPSSADMVFDMRFLANPHWQADLSELTGEDSQVQEYIKKDEAFMRFMDRVCDLLGEMLERFSAEGRPHFSVGLGCTGGKHRSVFAAITLAERLEKMGYSVALSHRDI